MKRGLTFIAPDHTLICLAYEEALKCGLEADSGGNADDGYWIEIYHCSLTDFTAILNAITKHEKASASGEAR